MLSRIAQRKMLQRLSCMHRCHTFVAAKTYTCETSFSYNNLINASKSSSFSSVANIQNKRAYPSYNIFGEASVLTIKPMMPKFRSVGKDIISVSQTGRMMFQFSPSTQSGIQWKNQISFAVTVEELGLLINQLPFHDVKLTRKLLGSDVGDGMNGKRYSIVSDDDDGVFKTLTATPIEGAAVLFEVDYKKDGVGGQTPPPNTNEHNWSFAPMNIIVSAGEWEVVRSLSKDSIPSLVGWRTSMDIAMNEAIENRS